MKTRVFAGLLALAATVFASSVSAQQQGFYLGGAYVQTKHNACGDVRSVFAMFAGSSVSSCDDTDTGFKVFGGYQVNRNFAVELTYIDWGNISGAGRLVGIPVSISGDVTSFGIAAVGILPLNERFSLFGKAGLLSSKATATISGGGITSSDDSSDSELHVGAGAMFNLNERWAIRGEWERATDNKLELLSIGVQFRF